MNSKKIASFLKQATVVFLLVLFVLIPVYWLRGRGVERSLLEASLWSFVAATIVFVNRIYRDRTGKKCRLCQDDSVIDPNG